MGDDSNIFEEVTFLVGPYDVPMKTQKCVLAALSPVFKAMLLGSMAETSHPVHLKEDCPEAFCALIEYVRSKKLVVEDFGVALKLAKMAHKYMMPDLMKECIKDMWKHYDHWYGFEFFEFLKMSSDDADLIRKAKLMSLVYMEELLESDRHLDVSVDTLIVLFKDSLNVQSEMTLLNALARYKEANDDPSLTDGIRKALSHIRLLTLEPHQVTGSDIIKKLLPQEDIDKIIKKFVSPSDSDEMPENLSQSSDCRDIFYKRRCIRTRMKESHTILNNYTTCTPTLKFLTEGVLYGVVIGVAGDQVLPLLDIILSLHDHNDVELYSGRFRLRNVTNRGNSCFFSPWAHFAPKVSLRLTVVILNRVRVSKRFCGKKFGHPWATIVCAEDNPIDFILKGVIFGAKESMK